MLLNRCLLSMFLLLFAGAVIAGNLPPPNPFLADSHNAMAHNDPAQQDAIPLPGPSGTSRQLSPEEIQYLHTGPAHWRRPSRFSAFSTCSTVSAAGWSTRVRSDRGRWVSALKTSEV